MRKINLLFLISVISPSFISSMSDGVAISTEQNYQVQGKQYIFFKNFDAFLGYYVSTFNDNLKELARQNCECDNLSNQDPNDQDPIIPYFPSKELVHGESQRLLINEHLVRMLSIEALGFDENDFMGSSLSTAEINKRIKKNRLVNALSNYMVRRDAESCIAFRGAFRKPYEEQVKLFKEVSK